MTSDHDLTVFDPGWPEQQLRNTMHAMQANGWTNTGLARVFKIMPASVASYLKMGTCGVCEMPHLKCSRRDWKRS